MDAEYKVVDRTRVTRELSVGTPLDWKNFLWIVHQVTERLRDAGRLEYDDACTIETRDDNLVFVWPVSEKTS